MTETAASKRVKQQSQTTLTNNKMLIPSKSPEDEVLTCQKPNASIFSFVPFLQSVLKSMGFC